MDESPEPQKPILCVDFDGVLHRRGSEEYSACQVGGPPVTGAAVFLAEAVEQFDVCVVSSRSGSPEGCDAMGGAVRRWLAEAFGEETGAAVFGRIAIAEHKPRCFLTLDDRAVTLTGTFPPVGRLLAFRPWTKR